MNHIDEPLNQIATHAADETEGRVSILDLARVKWVVLALLSGLLPGYMTLQTFGLAWAAIALFGPAVMVTLIQFFLLQDQPPGWFLDWVETRLTGAHLSMLNHPWL